MRASSSAPPDGAGAPELRVVAPVLMLAVSSALTLALGVVGATATPTYPTRFLVWNLFLAWIPLWCALGLRAVRGGAQLALGAAWLAFLPNAPYLLTDLVHLGERGEELWRHVLQYAFAAWTGTFLGVLSLRLVHREVERRRGVRVGWAAVAVSVGLCGLGVVIGRFQRWNSWDLVTRPRDVAASTFTWVRSPFAHVRSTGVGVAVALFFGVAYLTVWSLSALASPRPLDRDYGPPS